MERDSHAMFLGAVLRRARIAAGITSQDELADKLGYERTVIAKAESGQRPPSPDVARAYAREFPQLNALIDTGLIEEWAEHVRKNGGSFPKFFVDWVEAEKKAATLFYWAPILVPACSRSSRMPGRSWRPNQRRTSLPTGTWPGG